MGPSRAEKGPVGPVRAEWGCGGVGHALGFTQVEEGEAVWGRFGEWVQGPSGACYSRVRSRGLGLIRSLRLGPGYKDRPSGAARGRLEGLQG